jgi:hypothetical protein
VKGIETVHPETEILRFLRDTAMALRARLHRQGDGGYTTETVVVIALLVALAIAAIAIIAAKVLAKANSLDLG